MSIEFSVTHQSVGLGLVIHFGVIVPFRLLTTQQDHQLYRVHSKVIILNLLHNSHSQTNQK
jgi:hypothetical protein